MALPPSGPIAQCNRLQCQTGESGVVVSDPCSRGGLGQRSALTLTYLTKVKEKAWGDLTHLEEN